MFDLLIRDARLVDGTGAEARTVDVGVKDGRIAEIGALGAAPARRTIEARGQVLAPGFIDVHTHYDAQLFWDPTLSPSSFHGVTTVAAGNCGFSIAPLSKEMAPYLLRMLARVEGMPVESLEQGVPWDWEGFDEYLDRVEGRIGLNIGFMCGHSALRTTVMGERALSEKATPDELERMKALLAESLRAGALGFSSTISPTHNDAEGRPVPSRHASREELVALARVCRDHPGTLLEFLPGVAPFGDHEIELMTDLSLAAQRTLNWNAIAVPRGNDALLANQLSISDHARRAGGDIIGLALVSSPTVRINLHSGFVLDSLDDGWADLIRLPLRERMAALRDPARREALEKGALNGGGMSRIFGNWAGYTVSTSGDKTLQGRKVGEIAESRGKTPFDTFLDVSLADELTTIFLAPQTPDDEDMWRRRVALWRDDRTVIGASDAGAHLDMVDSFAFSTTLLAAARDHHLLGVEEAVHRLTQAPARLLGLKERGVVKEGWCADLVLFDPEAVGPGPVYSRRDLPGGQMRLYADAVGVSHVIVNGELIIEDGVHTGALPGSVLRSGKDTEHRPLAAAKALESAIN